MYGIYWKLNSIWYFIVLLTLICIVLAIYVYLRNKEKEFIYRFLMGIAITNMILHFLRPFFPPYVYEFSKYDNLRTLRVLGFENICAVNTILGPLLFKSKNNYVKDYYMLIAFAGGLLACTIPVAPYTERDLFSFDMIRYFICHISLLIIPLMSYIFKIHQFKFQRAFALPISFFCCMTLIYLNENISYDLGWVVEKRNFSMVYGPAPQSGALGDFLLSLVPGFLKNYTDSSGNFVTVAPLVWFITPFIILLLPLSYITYIALDFKNFKQALFSLIKKIKRNKVENNKHIQN